MNTFLILISMVFVSVAAHRGGGGGGHGGGGGRGRFRPNNHNNNNRRFGPTGGQHNRGNNNWNYRNRYNNNNNGPHQSHFNQNHGLISFQNPNIVNNCNKPVFEDAELEIENCLNNQQHSAHNPVCFNPEARIPVEWKAKMVCKRGNHILKFSSYCLRDGTWSPEFLDNCDQLFELQASEDEDYDDNESEESETSSPAIINQQGRLHPCQMLKIRLSNNFLLTCLTPGFTVDSNDQCVSPNQNVLSGTRVFLKCKPPFQSSINDYSKWICDNGKWSGNMSKMLCIHAAPTKPQYPVEVAVDPFEGSNHPTIQPPSSEPPPDYGWLVTQPPTVLTTTTTEQPITIPTTVNHGRVMCPPLSERVGIQIECIFGGYKGSNVYGSSCKSWNVVGTEATYKCRQYYETSASLSVLYRTCKEDGTWTGNSDTFICVAQCGKVNNILSPRITYGVATYRSQWPWHATIFLQEKSTTWKYLCGGSILTSRAVITAAHCLTYFQNKEPRNPEMIRIELAKYKIDERDEFVQIKEIQSIEVHDSYNPFSYESDIGILILKDDIEFGYHVRPICFPQTSDSALEEQQLATGSVGIVVGFGIDETGKLADELKMTQLKVVSPSDCSEIDGAGELISRSTTYCAGLKNKTNVCNGDSGGGMYFPLRNADSSRYYLQGIVSAGISDDTGKCDPNKYSVFTRVGRYAQWIIRTLSHYDVF